MTVAVARELVAFLWAALHPESGVTERTCSALGARMATEAEFEEGVADAVAAVGCRETKSEVG